MAVFSNLSEKLNHIFSKLTKRGKLTELEIKEAMREIRIALLEADVNYGVAKEFINSVSEKAVGEAVMQSLTPGQQVVKIVHEELVELLGSKDEYLNISPNPPTVIMLAGLQGSGKTTMAGKLANMLRKSGKKPIMVACDIYRPAAIDQLEVIGKQLNIPVYSDRENKDVVEIAKAAFKEANSKLYDVIILDTAGRLHIDETLMDELKRLKEFAKPHEVLLVVDAMTGQDAVNVSQSFNEKLGIDGVIITKLDGDTRGGAALSVKSVTGKPIKFIGTGEKMNDIEVFHPDRMATRILGMGDVLTLIEKAEEAFDEEEAEKIEKSIRKQTFTLQNYLDQLKQIKRLGSMKAILGMIGIDEKALENSEAAEKQFRLSEAIIQSMTLKERNNPDILNGSRRRRIAAGAGTTVQEVNRFIKQYNDTKMMMKKVMNNKGAINKMIARAEKGGLNIKDLKKQ